VDKTAFEKTTLGFNNRSIAIVGNATSILKSNFGQLIDTFDIVIRMNRGLPVAPEAQGSKFDLWCFSTGAWVRKELKTYVRVPAVWMSPKLRERFDGSYECAFYPTRNWELLQQKIGERPSVGCMTIDMVSAGQPERVGIFGFDFKRSGTFYEDRIHLGPHNYSAEERYTLGKCEAANWEFYASNDQ